MRKLLIAASLITSTVFGAGLPKDGRIDIWPTIPFVRGADLCKYLDAYGQTRNEYMDGMVQRAKSLMEGGAKGKEALQLLVEFNSLYDRNQAIATQHQYMDVTLEATLKSYLDSYYRNLKPKDKKVSFTHVNDIYSVIRATNNGQRDGYLNDTMLAKLDYIAYGTYALAPTCRGDIQVTIHMIGKNGKSESFVATGNPQTVMSQIATEIFEKYQRTQFNNGTIRIGKKQLQLVGALNGTVGTVSSPELAEEACDTLDARLPTRLEMELLDSYGDWSGGVTLGEKAWAYPGGKVYHPLLRNPTPIREKWEVNDDEFLYYCVR